MSNPQAEKMLIGGLYATGLSLFVFANSFSQWVGCVGSVAVAETIRRRRQWSYTEVIKGTLGYAQEAIGEMNESFSPVGDALERGRVQVVSNVLKQLPMGEVLAERFVKSQGLRDEWFSSFCDRPFVIVGESGDGKTYLLRWSLQQFLQQYPNGKVYIADIDYGLAHKGSQPNDWFGLPVDSVCFITPESITGMLKELAEMLEEGESNAPVLLLVDEWVSYIQSLPKPKQEEVITTVRNLQIRGLKRNFNFVLGLHSLAAGECLLDTAILRRFDVLYLYRASQEKRNYDNIGASSQAIASCIERMNGLSRVVRGLRPCVVYAEKELNVRALPDLSIPQIEIVEAPNIDPDEQWLDDAWTVDIEAQIYSHMNARVNEGKSAICYREQAPLLGISRKHCVADNRRYQLAKAQIEAFAQKMFPQPEKQETGDREAIAI